MRLGKGYKRAARRFGIAALLVMAPVWLTACGTRGNDTGAAAEGPSSPLSSPSASVAAPPSSASASASAASPAPSETAPSPAATGAAAATFAGADGGEVKLPLIGVPTEYGVDEGDAPPTLLPTHDLPVQSFDIPPDQASRLALYWMNLGYSDEGFMMLAPRDWTAKGGVGANGSFSLDIVDPSDAGSFLGTYDTGGGCQGCAIQSIGSYFPKLAKWAEEQGFGTDQPMTYVKSASKGEHMLEFEQASEDGQKGHAILGAAYEEHEGGALFRVARTGYAEDERALAETMISYYEWLYGGQ